MAVFQTSCSWFYIALFTFYSGCEGRDLIKNIVSNGGHAQYLSSFIFYHRNLPLYGFATNKRYFEHGFGIAGFFKFHRDYIFLVKNILINILASLFIFIVPRNQENI